MAEDRIGTPRDSALITQTPHGVTVMFDTVLRDVPLFGFSFFLSWAEANIFADLTERVGLEGLSFTAGLDLYLVRAGPTFYFFPLWSGQLPENRWSEDRLSYGRELPVPLLLDAWRAARVPGEYAVPCEDIPPPLQAYVIPWSRDLYGRHERTDFTTPAIVGFQGYPDVALVESHASILADLIRSVRQLGVKIENQHGSVTVFPRPDGSLLLALQASTWDNQDARRFSLEVRAEERAVVAAGLSSAAQEAVRINEPLAVAARHRAELLHKIWGQSIEDDASEAMN